MHGKFGLSPRGPDRDHLRLDVPNKNRNLPSGGSEAAVSRMSKKELMQSHLEFPTNRSASHNAPANARQRDSPSLRMANNR